MSGKSGSLGVDEIAGRVADPDAAQNHDAVCTVLRWAKHTPGVTGDEISAVCELAWAAPAGRHGLRAAESEAGVSVSERHAYAIAHPLARADLGLDVMAALKADDPLPGGNWLRSIPAVDR